MGFIIIILLLQISFQKTNNIQLPILYHNNEILTMTLCTHLYIQVQNLRLNHINTEKWC